MECPANSNGAGRCRGNALSSVPSLASLLSAVQRNDMVVVGMAMNPVPVEARKALCAIGSPHRISNTATISTTGAGATR